MTKIVIADDHRVVRSGLRMLLDLEAVFTVEEHAEAAAHHAVVVGDHDLGHRKQASGVREWRRR